MRDFMKPMLRLAILLGIVIGVIAIYLVFSPPGGQDTVDQNDRPDPRPEPPVHPLECLRSAWDSEEYADWPVAELLAAMSKQAYCTPKQAESTFRRYGFGKVTPVKAGSLIGYVACYEDMMVIAFRGTDDIQDWLINLNRFAVKTPHGEIHKGFYNAYQSLKPQILGSLKEKQPKHLWITGHSLGGALALVCAYDLTENEKIDLDGIITFGQPMVARKQLAEHLDAVLLGRYAFYVNGSDLVPRVPPSCAHCGSLVWFTDNGIKRSTPKRQLVGAKDSLPAQSEVLEPLSEQEFKQLQAKLREEMAESKRLPNGTHLVEGEAPFIRDHSIELYLEKIQRLTGNIGSK